MVQKTEDFSDGATSQDLPRLRALCAEKPDTTMALVRAAWPQIRLALEAGHTLKRVCRELNHDGLTIGYKTLSAYVGRLCREQASNVRPRGAQGKKEPFPVSVPVPRKPVPAVSDQLTPAMEACARPRYDIIAAHCDGDPTKKKLI
jgi:hypothetical protein